MNKKKIVTVLLTSVMLSSSISGIYSSISNNSTVQAVAKKKYVTVRGKKHQPLYTSKGKKTKSYASPKKKYVFHGKKKIKIGKKYYVAYRLSSNRYLLAKNAAWVISKPKKQYQEAQLTLPAGYTKDALLKAYKGHPSAAFVNSCMSGMLNNQFKYSESATDDNTIIDPANLTTDQKQELTDFSLKLINEVRSQLNLPPWVSSTGVQKLADDIAQEYATHNRSIKDGDHYVAGIVRACQKNGLNLNDNYVEDMAGFNESDNQMTMTAMKKNVYFGLKQMIFGYVGSNESGAKQINNYREWEHAGDLFNTQGSSHDGDYNYYGFSISKTGNVYSLHYISVPSFVVKSPQYNKNFRP